MNHSLLLDSLFSSGHSIQSYCFPAVMRQLRQVAPLVCSSLVCQHSVTSPFALLYSRVVPVGFQAVGTSDPDN